MAEKLENKLSILDLNKEQIIDAMQKMSERYVSEVKIMNTQILKKLNELGSHYINSQLGAI